VKKSKEPPKRYYIPDLIDHITQCHPIEQQWHVLAIPLSTMLEILPQYGEARYYLPDDQLVDLEDEEMYNPTDDALEPSGSGRPNLSFQSIYLEVYYEFPTFRIQTIKPQWSTCCDISPPSIFACFESCIHLYGASISQEPFSCYS
jgi:hypothetical protein